MGWALVSAWLMGGVSLLAWSHDPADLGVGAAVLAWMVGVALLHPATRALRVSPVTCFGLAVGVATLANARLAPISSEAGTPGPRVALLLAVPIAAAGWSAISFPRGRFALAMVAISGACAVVLCARAWNGAAVPVESALADLPSVELSRGNHSRAVRADGTTIRLVASYGEAQVCPEDASRCVTLPLWGRDLLGMPIEVLQNSPVRLAWTPRLWIVSTRGSARMTFALDRETMKPVPLGVGVLGASLSAPRLWSRIAIGGVVVAVAAGVFALIRAHRSRWLVDALPGTLHAEGILTVGDLTASFDGAVPPGNVSVQVLDVARDAYRGRTTVGVVVEGTPAEARARWLDDLTTDLSAAGMVALIAAAPLVGAAVAGLSAGAP